MITDHDELAHRLIAGRQIDVGKEAHARRGIEGHAAMQSPIAFWMCAAGALVLAAACFVALLYRVTTRALHASSHAAVGN